MLVSVDINTWFADLDLGKQFSNYFMHEVIRKYSRVDVTAIFESKNLDWRVGGGGGSSSNQLVKGATFEGGNKRKQKYPRVAPSPALAITV